jgi:hypothetical protein
VTRRDPLDPLEVLPTVTEIIDGPIAPLDRVYAFDRVRDACRTSPRPVRRAHLRLVAQPRRSGRRPAVAEGTLVLDGGVVVCAGVVAATVREAVDDLVARIRRRVRGATRYAALSRSVDPRPARPDRCR